MFRERDLLKTFFYIHVLYLTDKTLELFFTWEKYANKKKKNYNQLVDKKKLIYNKGGNWCRKQKSPTTKGLRVDTVQSSLVASTKMPMYTTHQLQLPLTVYCYNRSFLLFKALLKERRTQSKD